MADKVLKILGVHGLGDPRVSGWQRFAHKRLRQRFQRCRPHHDASNPVPTCNHAVRGYLERRPTSDDKATDCSGIWLGTR